MIRLLYVMALSDAWLLVDGDPFTQDDIDAGIVIFKRPSDPDGLQIKTLISPTSGLFNTFVFETGYIQAQVNRG